MVMSTGTLQHIFRYPLKSALGEGLSEATMAESGLTGDRAFALIDCETGKVVSAKRPRLWGAMPFLAAEALPGDEGIAVRFPDGRVLTSASKQLVPALSLFLGRDIELAKLRQHTMRLERARPEEVAERGLNADVTMDINALAAETPGPGFQDLAPVHLVCLSTLQAIAKAAGLSDAAIKRYRPNLVMATNGCVPFCENNWIGHEVIVGSARLKVTGPTPRCAIPMLAHGAGEQFQPEILRAINRLNRIPVEGHGPLPCAGVYARVLHPGAVRIGDRFQIGQGTSDS